MVPKISAQLFSQSLLTGTFALISMGNAIASEIPTVKDSAPDSIASSTDATISKISAIYPINTILDSDFSPVTSDLALARRKKRINTKRRIFTQPQIQNTPRNIQPRIQNTPSNIQPQIQNTPNNTQLQIQNTPSSIQPQVQNTPPPMPSGFSATQNQIQYKRNDLGVAVQFGNGTSIGMQGKLGLTDNISIRPEFFFGNGGGEVENKPEPISETNRAGEVKVISRDNNSVYEIKDESILTKSFTAPSPLVIGKDFVTNDASITLQSPMTLPPGTIFSKNTVIEGGSVLLANEPVNKRSTLPAGAIIPAGTFLPAATLFPENTVFAAGTVLPSGTTTSAPSFNEPLISVVKVDSFAINLPLVLTADYKIISSFTPNLPIGDNFPAGKVIPAGTVLPKGTVIPANTIFPVDSRTSNNIPVAIAPGAIKSKIKQSTSLGLAVTYDFKLDPAGKSTAYLGPKIAYTANVGDLTLPGAQTQTLNTNETKIGLIAGLDYVLFDGFTIGANANYYFSRSLSGSATSPTGVSIPFQSVGGGSSTDFGLRIGYQF